MTDQKKLRVALCLYGQPRFYKSQAYFSLKYAIIDRYEADVFFHAWWSPEVVGEKVYKTAPHLGGVTLKAKEGVEDDLVDLYKPKAYRVDPPQVFSIDEHLRPSRLEREVWSKSYVPSNALSMYRSIKYVQELKKDYETEHGFKYDWVIMARYDHFLPEFVPLEKLPRSYMYVPDTCPNPKACNDNLLICSSEEFDNLGLVFDEMRINLLNSVDLSFEALRVAHWKRHKLFDRVRRLTDLQRQTFVRS